MEEQAYLVPSRPGLKVPYAEKEGYLPAEGAQVPMTKYWRRRIMDGDVREGKPAAPPEPVNAKAKPKK